MKILVAMSGGVDSSTVAYILKEQGHDLVGVMMKLWSDPLAPTVRRTLPKKCCSIEHIERARSVCRSLDIPFYVLNLEEEFKNEVVDYFIDGYKNGLTPNPCIECNRSIKFGALLQKAEELGCEKVATGHYAIVDSTNSGLALFKAKDKNRDQSYYLYTLAQKKLESLLFPLGKMDKTDVFKLAKTFNIDIPRTYNESEDLCFFPEKDPAPFLERYIDNIKTGDIKTEDGSTVGTHKGIPFYTIGQRKGLGIGGLKIPLYVTNKNAKTNTLYVAQGGKDGTSDLRVEQANWIEGQAPTVSKELRLRIHSLGRFHEGIFIFSQTGFQFTFPTPIRGIAPGQSAVVYRGNQVLGGGIII